MDLFKVALRNVQRNSRRSLITALTVFIGIVVVCSTRGLLNGLQGEIRGGLTEKINGDIQVHRSGYRDVIDASPYKIIFNYKDLQAKLLSSQAVEAVAPRLKIMGLLNHQISQTSTPVMITGIDSVNELKVCPRLKDAVQDGQLLDSRLEKSQGESTDDEENLEVAASLDDIQDDGVMAATEVDAKGSFHQIMLTQSLMTGLGAKIGDEIVILIQDQDNMQQAIVTRIAAVIDYALPAAVTRAAWMDLSTLQNLAKAKGMTSELAIRKSRELPLEIAKESIEQLTSDATITETWLEISGFLADILGLQDIIFSVIVAVVFSIMISAIVNTSLMTVMERTREIGTLAALGYRRKHIMFLFLTESSAISLMGGVLGAAIATIVITILNKAGITVALPGQKVAITLYPFLTVKFLLMALGLAVVSALFASLVPSYRASRMKPVEALSSN